MAAGVRQQLHEDLLATLRAAGVLDLSAALADSACLRALKGYHARLSPVDRRRPGSKHHLIIDAGCIPLARTLTGGAPAAHDSTIFDPVRVTSCASNGTCVARSTLDRPAVVLVRGKGLS